MYPGRYTDLAVGPRGRYAYRTNSTSARLDVIDMRTEKLAFTIRLDRPGGGVAVAPNGKRVYVTREPVRDEDFAGDQTVAVIDVGRRRIVDRIPFEGILADRNQSALVVMDAAALQVIARIRVAGGADDVAPNAAGTRAYVAATRVNVIDTLAGTNLGQIQIAAVGRRGRRVAGWQPRRRGLEGLAGDLFRGRRGFP